MLEEEEEQQQHSQQLMVLPLSVKWQHGNCLLITYIRDVGSLVLSEFLVVAQEEDGVLEREGVVKVALGLALCCALHLQADGRTDGRWQKVKSSSLRLQLLLAEPAGASHLLQLSQEAVQGLVRQLAHLEHGDGVALQVLTQQRERKSVCVSVED